ncbi:MAG TPA: ATP-binding protein [Acidimicrobiales bacterium]
MSLDIEQQAQFATEFALFLVALAGLAIVLLRAELLTAAASMRVALALGFASIGAAAFAHGSLLADTSADPVVLGARAVGWLLVGLGTLKWNGGPVAKRLVFASVALGAGGVAADAAEADLLAGALRALAALTLGGALLQSSRRAIAARVAASSAATLLLVVLVLSVGLSAVLSNTVEDQAVASLDARALREAGVLEDRRNEAIKNAGLASSGLTQGRTTAPAIGEIADTGAVGPEQRDVLDSALETLSSGLFDGFAVAYADARVGLVSAVGLPPAVFVELLGHPAAQEATSSEEGRGAVVLLDDQAVAVGVVPVRRASEGPGQHLGLVLAAFPADRGYLESRGRADDAVSLQLWSRTAPVASYGVQPERAVAQRLAGAVFAEDDASAAEISSGRYVAGRAVRGTDNRPLLALIASRPTTAVDEIRERLFQTFFVIAFGGTLLALLLAALVGERIGAGVRRLTRSAEQLAQGEAGVRSGVRSEDEVGRLGAAFDAMAESIEEKTDALRQAALDEARLRNRVEAIVAGMGEALVAFDEDACVTDFNEAAEELLGVTAPVARGRSVVEVVRARTEDGGADLSARIEAADDARWSELAEVEAADGVLVPVAMTVGPVRGPGGEVAGRVIVLRDLRAEREVERMKREFLSRVGHELRTPLTPLLGFARILATKQLPPDRAQDVLRSMVSSGQRLERIVEMLEFFASAQAGRTPVRLEAIDVRELLTSVVDERQRAMDANGHVLSRRVKAGTPRVVGDPYWVRRSVDELVDNAIKFSPSGGKVSVTAAPAGDFVEIAVRDPGVGMSDEEVERAFAEWTQGDESDTRAYGGLGLGLALVQRVVERHGGRVVCETAPGKGSKFSILLPAVPMQVDDAANSGTRAPRRNGRARNQRVRGSGQGEG